MCKRFQQTKLHLGILLNTLCVLYAPTLGIDVKKAATHKEIRLTTPSENLFMNMPSLLKCCCTSACIQQPNKDDSVLLHSFTLHLLR
jgi:hypothetical protein